MHLEELNDVELIASHKGGERDAFGILYGRYVEKIYRFVYFKVMRKESAEDITSDVFFKALEKIGTFDESKGPFSAWLYQIARNAVIDHYRMRKVAVDIEDVFDLGVDDRIAEGIDARDTLLRISKYVQMLTPKQREIVVLRVWEEMPYKEIAKVVGGSEDSVKMAFSRAIREIREKFGPLSALLILVARPW